MELSESLGFDFTGPLLGAAADETWALAPAPAPAQPELGWAEEPPDLPERLTSGESAATLAPRGSGNWASQLRALDGAAAGGGPLASPAPPLPQPAAGGWYADCGTGAAEQDLEWGELLLFEGGR